MTIASPRNAFSTEISAPQRHKLQVSSAATIQREVQREPAALVAWWPDFATKPSGETSSGDQLWGWNSDAQLVSFDSCELIDNFQSVANTGPLQTVLVAHKL